MFVFFGENAVTQHNLHECDVIKILKSNYYSVISSFNYPKIFCVHSE
jgi:hypothetical protein